ncbi:MAG: hypothetical protein OEO23_12930, partial [Gemmatimonadota bacterium]|nr:hypothetical protein [Gemmatimonadota bacterium]
MARRIEPQERRDATRAFFTLFGFMMGHALLETARDALFLARVSATRLPWVYLTIAAIALMLTQRQPRILRRVGMGSELTGWLVFAGAGSFLFWGLAGLGSSWVFYALYVWTGVLASLLVVRFWTRVGGLYTVTQAKRIF